MYVSAVFIPYVITLLISFVCLVFIALIFVRKRDRNNKSFIAVRRFAIATMLTDLLYFVFYYREVLLGVYELHMPFRIIDYILCPAVFSFWLFAVEKMIDSSKHRFLRPINIVLTISRMVISLFVTIFFMGTYYEIENPLVRTAWGIADTVFVVLTAILMIYYTICSLMESTIKIRSRYVVAVSVLLLVWSVAQNIVDIGLFENRYGVSAWMKGVPDPTGICFFLVMLATGVFIFREDFSPLFLPESLKGSPGTVKSGISDTDIKITDEKGSLAADSLGAFELESLPPTGDDKKSEETSARGFDLHMARFAPSEDTGAKETDIDTRLDMIAMAHKLTVREREVLVLLYKGYTNPDIAENLFITINTVKKHIHNIFEKMGAKSRTEVVYIINSWRERE